MVLVLITVSFFLVVYWNPQRLESLLMSLVTPVLFLQRQIKYLLWWGFAVCMLTSQLLRISTLCVVGRVWTVDGQLESSTCEKQPPSQSLCVQIDGLNSATNLDWMQWRCLFEYAALLENTSSSVKAAIVRVDVQEGRFSGFWKWQDHQHLHRWSIWCSQLCSVTCLERAFKLLHK